MSGSNCCFLTCIQISQEAGQVVWYSHLLKNFWQFVVSHTVKDFSVVNEAKVYVLLEFSCSSYDPTDVGSSVSGSSAFCKGNLNIYSSTLNIWKFSVHVLLKPHLEDFEHYFASVWDECNCGIDERNWQNTENYQSWWIGTGDGFIDLFSLLLKCLKIS